MCITLTDVHTLCINTTAILVIGNIGSVVERRSSELHTNLVRVCASQAPKYFQVGGCINLSICMWFGCRRADPVVSPAYHGMPRYVLAFRHFRQPFVIATSREKGLLVRTML